MIKTPYYCIDQTRLLASLERIALLRQQSGARVLLALKGFATWSVFDLMRPYLDGTTSSSLYEVKLGREKFGGETHAYSVAWADDEFAAAAACADKVIFNSYSQLLRFAKAAPGKPLGLRFNPGVSVSGFDLADPARAFSRLGESSVERLRAAVADRLISGVMLHNNCENADFARFDAMLGAIEARLGDVFAQLDWISLGGGIAFTAPDYPLAAFAARLAGFAERYGVTVYLEPGEAAAGASTTLETTVLDVIENGKPIAIVDASSEAHMLDLLIYREPARVVPDAGPHRYLVCGKSCLAGDVFGEFAFAEPLQVGSRIAFHDAGAYTMVKKNWFNGLNMPAIVIRDSDGSERLVREFTYQDYLNSLS